MTAITFTARDGSRSVWRVSAERTETPDEIALHIMAGPATVFAFVSLVDIHSLRRLLLDAVDDAERAAAAEDEA